MFSLKTYSNNYSIIHTIININNTLILYSSSIRNRILVLLESNLSITIIRRTAPLKFLVGY